MPHMMVIPPGLDFTNLKVDLPKDPALEEMKSLKPAFGGSPVGSDAGSPRAPVRGGSMTNLRNAEADKPLTRSGKSGGGSGLVRPVSMASLRSYPDGVPLLRCLSSMGMLLCKAISYVKYVVVMRRQPSQLLRLGIAASAAASKAAMVVII